MTSSPRRTNRLTTALALAGASRTPPTFDRTPDGQDGRVVRLHPSEVAEGERARLDGGAGDVYRAVVSQLGEDEQRVLREAVPVIWRMAEVLARPGGVVATDDGQSTR